MHISFYFSVFHASLYLNEETEDCKKNLHDWFLDIERSRRIFKSFMLNYIDQ